MNDDLDRNWRSAVAEIERLSQKNNQLRNALVEYFYAMEGFADAVRQETGLPYPWPAQENARDKVTALLQSEVEASYGEDAMSDKHQPIKETARHAYERARWAACERFPASMSMQRDEYIVEQILSAVIPAIRKNALEDAADKANTGCRMAFIDGADERTEAAAEIENAIRAMIDGNDNS